MMQVIQKGVSLAANVRSPLKTVLTNNFPDYVDIVAGTSGCIVRLEDDVAHAKFFTGPSDIFVKL